MTVKKSYKIEPVKLLPRKSETHTELMFSEQSHVATVKSLLLIRPREDISPKSFLEP